jgi:hypothetical protein
VYKIEYYKERLQVLEHFDNGEFIFAGRLKFKRYYNASKTHSDPTYYDFISNVSDVTKKEKKASVVLIHGFA